MKTTPEKLSEAIGSPDSDPFDGLLGYHLRRLSVLVMADLAESLAPFGLKPTDASILFVIGSHPGVTQSDIGRTLGVQRANMTPLVAALLKKRLIKREPVDGRSQALVLSAAGNAIRDKAWRAAKAHEARMFGTVAKTQRAALMIQLRALWQTMAGNGRDEL